MQTFVRYLYHVNVLKLIHIFTFDIYHSMQQDLCSSVFFMLPLTLSTKRELFSVIDGKCSFVSFSELRKLVQATTLLTCISLDKRGRYKILGKMVAGILRI